MRGFGVLTEDRWNAERFLNEKPRNTEVTLKERCAILEGADPWPRLLVTEYLPGPEYSVDAFMGVEEQVAIPRLRKVIRSNITFESRAEIREDLVNYTLLAGRRLGLQYAFGFQYKLDAENTPKVLECDPCVQGTMVASTLAGVNVIWMAVMESLGDAVSSVPKPVDGAEFYRYWGGVCITNGSIQDIQFVRRHLPIPCASNIYGWFAKCKRTCPPGRCCWRDATHPFGAYSEAAIL